MIKLFIYEREDRIGGLLTYGFPNMKFGISNYIIME